MHLLLDAFSRSEGGAGLRPWVRVVGVGQRLRGDDAAGLELAECLRDDPLIDVVIGAADPATLLTQLEGADAIIVVDCARGGGAPGAILRLTADEISTPPLAGSSHGNALAGALGLGVALGSLPPRLTIFAVVGQSFALGEPLSPPVRAALPTLCAQVLREAAALRGGG